MAAKARGKGQRAPGTVPPPPLPAGDFSGRSELARLCRALLEHAARAERFTMAEWLAVRSHGRTMKAAYAEAARLACELSTAGGTFSAPGSAGVPPAGSARLDSVQNRRNARAPRDRDRRPVLILTRELRECLDRIAARVERGEALPAGAEETLAAIDALLAGER